MPEFYMIIARQLQIFSRFFFLGGGMNRGSRAPPPTTPHPSTTSPAMFPVWYVYMFLTDRSGPYDVIDDVITQ